jgi:hypothetical protein
MDVIDAKRFETVEEFENVVKENYDNYDRLNRECAH